MVIVQQNYNPQSPERKAEIKEAFNYTLPLLNDDDELFITLLAEDLGLMTYGIMFQKAFQEYPEEDVFVFANSDIGFDSTIKIARYIPDGEFWCISRIDVVDRVFLGKKRERQYIPFHHNYSQDVWICSRKTLQEIILNPELFYITMGTPGCENTLAKVVSDMGITVKNPCYSINCYHFHQSGIRNYSEADRYPKEGYLFVEPCKL